VNYRNWWVWILGENNQWSTNCRKWFIKPGGGYAGDER